MAACAVVPVAAIVPVWHAGTYRHIEGPLLYMVWIMGAQPKLEGFWGCDPKSYARRAQVSCALCGCFLTARIVEKAVFGSRVMV